MKYKVLKNRSIFLLASTLTLLSFSTSAKEQYSPENYPRTESALQADDFFWYVFNNGDYDSIPLVINALTAAYIEDPNDATTSGHIGALHLWRLSEQERLDVIPATITDHILLARKYLQQSINKDPHNAIYLGQLGATMMSEGEIDREKNLVRKGFSYLLQSRRNFPEFNNFTVGYLGSRLPPNTKFFKKGLEYLWKNIDICINEKIDRHNPDMTPYLHLQTTEGDQRVCWNGSIAPHNFEGFFLTMGDMLVKSGDWRLAKKIYANAKLALEYDSWQYQNILEHRILNAEENVTLFNAPLNEFNRPVNPILSQSSFSCSACHQQ